MEDTVPFSVPVYVDVYWIMHPVTVEPHFQDCRNIFNSVSVLKEMNLSATCKQDFGA